MLNIGSGENDAFKAEQLGHTEQRYLGAEHNIGGREHKQLIFL